MIRKKLGQIEWLEFELLSDFQNLAHGVFLRHGGVSLPSQFASLNASFGDDIAHAQENRSRMCQVLSINSLAFGKHIHDAHVALLEKKSEPEYSGYDGLITHLADIGLLITHADCQAAIFYDPIHHVCANVHAGWRGQVKNIYRNTIEKMKEQFSSKPSDLLVCISPSLGPEHAEFVNYQNELPKDFWKFQVKPTFFDLWAISRHQLEEAGILPHHIQIAQIDTFANPKDFFSYRREKKAGRVEKVTGCHGTIVALRT